MVKIAVSAGVLGSLAFAAPSLATAPLAGTNCQADGKIAANGATFARNLQHLALIPGYRDDICGPVSNAVHPTDMVLYNETISGEPATLPTWPTGTIGSPLRVGSGAGIAGNKCRGAAFQGTDTPYSNAQIALTRGAPPAADAECVTLSGDAAFNPPFEPTTGGSFPDPSDVAAVSPQAGTANGAMSFPIGGAAIAMGINLTSTECPGLPAGARPVVNLDGTQASRLMGGTATQWNDAALVALSPDLASCAFPVTRVVRLDSSGTTTQFKNYLAKADPTVAPNPRICDPALSWPGLKANNTQWPTNPPAGTCPAAGAPGQLIRPALNGGTQVVATVASTPGAIGYADLENWNQNPTAAQLAGVRANTGGLFVAPASGQGSNCSFQGAVMPGSGAAGAVGLSPINANWATNAAPNRSDITFIGAGYPICAFTWALVYTGLNGNNPADNTAIARLNDNQRRTLYTYMLYTLSPIAQARLAANGYAALPVAFQTRLRQGFSENY